MVRQSNGRNIDARRRDCRTGEGAQGRNSKLHATHAIGAGGDIGCTGNRLPEAVRETFEAMKGTTLARYLLIVNMTIGGVKVCAALPQQSDSQGVGYHPESSSIDSPTAKQPTGGLPEQPSKKSRLRSDLGDTVTHVFEDQKPIWLSPLNVRLSDAEWLAPLTGITTGAILTDASLSKALPGSAHRLSTYNSIRNAGVGALGAASGGLYLWSLRTHDPH